MNNEKTVKRIQDLVPDKGEDLYRCNRAWEAWEMRTMSEYDFEIVEKPITLEIILQAMFMHEGRTSFGIEGDIANNTGRKRSDMIFTSGHLTWNLSKDNFNDQSDETKTFIGELLN